MHELRYTLRVKSSRMLPVIRKLRREGQACVKPAAFGEWFNNVSIVQPQPFAAVSRSCKWVAARRDLDDGRGRITEYRSPLVQMLENAKAHEADMWDFKLRGKGGVPTIFDSFGADQRTGHS